VWVEEDRRRRPRPLFAAISAIVLALVVVPAGPAFAWPIATTPSGERLQGYRNGLEPGSELAGYALPIDWSQRTPPCPKDPWSASQLWEVDGTRPALCPGERTEAVSDLQRLLTEKRLYRGPITGVYDGPTRHAVVAFHKVIGPAHSDPRTAVAGWKADPPPEDWSEVDWLLLEAFEPRPPKYRPGQPDRVEVDIGHQVLYLIAGGEVAAIIPVSTGKGSGTVGCRDDGCDANVTPRTTRFANGGSFNYEHRYGRGWSPLPGVWSIYKGIFYRGHYGEWNYGIHGYRDVPSYPASHGCIRVTVWDMDYLRPWDEDGRYAEDARVWVGMPVHVWDA
jgi:hypothetical protein